MFNKSKKTYGFRKSKEVTTIGGTEVGNKVIKGAVATAVAVLPLALAGVANADEVDTATNTNPNPATNLVDAQPTPTEENTAMVNNADTPSQDMTGTVDTSARDTAVTTAENAGVDVTTDNTTKTYDNIADAQADIANQTATVKEATDKANANAKAIADAEAQNAQIDAENKAEAERVAKANAEGQKAVDEANAKAKAEVDAKNAEIKAAVDKVSAKNKEAMEAVGLTYTGNYQKDLEAVNKFNEDEKNKALADEASNKFNEVNNNNVLGANDGWVQHVGSNGYTQSGTSQFKKAQTVNGVEIVANGSLEPGKTTVYVKGDVDQSHIIKKINWGNVAPEGANLNGNIGTDWAGAYHYNDNGTTNQIWKGKILQWYRIPQAITMLDGSVHDAYVMFHTDTSGLASPADEVVFWNQDGAINVIDGYRLGVNDRSDAVRTVIRVDTPENEQNYLWISLLGDFDMGQYLQAENNVVVLGLGGGFATNSGVGDNQIAVDENLGANYGINYGYNALDGFHSAPDGVALIAQYGREYSTVIRNTPGGNASSVSRADFGAEAKVKIDKVYKAQHVEIEEPTNTHPATFTPQKFTPEVPVVKPHVEVPEKENYSISVHPVEVKENPTISKSVSNDSGQDVDGKLVPKGAEAPYTLDVGSLTAGRPQLAENGGIIIYDSLPSGYFLSEAEMEKTISEAEKLGFTTEYDEATSTFKFTLNADEIKKVNANRLTSDYDIPNPVIYGTPINDNATYINASTLVLTPTDSSGKELDKITTTSNKVVIYTAGTDDPEDKEHGGSTIQPTKQVLDENGNDIDGKAVEKGQKIVYVGKWDLDQYKDIMAGAVAISKGFGFIDNYDESAVTMDIAGTTITSASGKTVTGLTPYVVKNLSDAPQEIKDLVVNAGIEIADNDEFVIWVADDPQAFYDEYVVTGDSIFFTMPAQVKDDFEGEQFDNIVYQIDFGNGYAGNVVTNKVETPVEPETPAEPEVLKPTPEVPVVKASVLPETGETSNGMLATIGMFILTVLTAFTFGKFKKSEE